MAANTGVRFSYTLLDELGIESSVTQHAFVDNTNTLASAIDAWTTLGGLLNAITSGQIVRGRLDLPLEANEAWKTSPDAGSRVEQTGLFNFRAGSTPFRAATDVPSLLSSKISSGKINNADTDIAAFIDALLAAVLGGNYTNLTYVTLAAFMDSILSFRKRRKQLSRSSYNVTAP